jgi:hypothetical protein
MSIPSHSQNPVGFGNGFGKSGKMPAFSPKSKVTFPKTSFGKASVFIRHFQKCQGIIVYNVQAVLEAAMRQSERFGGPDKGLRSVASAGSAARADKLWRSNGVGGAAGLGEWNPEPL